MDLYKAKKTAGILGRLTAVFLLLNIGIFTAVFRRPKRRWKKHTYDCAVVCGYYAEEDGSPSPFMRTRVEKGAGLLREGKVKALLLSGGAVSNSHVEAEVMRDHALKLGVPADVIYTEPRSVSTYHNMKYSRELMSENGLKDCVVVTNGWHLRKADHYAGKFRMDHVMCRADDPPGQTWRTGIMLYIKTWWNMYRNLFRGYH